MLDLLSLERTILSTLPCVRKLMQRPAVGNQARGTIIDLAANDGMLGPTGSLSAATILGETSGATGNLTIEEGLIEMRGATGIGAKIEGPILPVDGKKNEK
jgi:hypothetical protein